jgi:tyrosinase
MISVETMRPGNGPGVLVADVSYVPESGAGPFTRADLLVFGVDHRDRSYEVRVFFNNPEAGPDTPRDREQGYAGRFVVFGHGGCYGDLGHCEVPTERPDPHDLRPPHALTPHTKHLDLSEALSLALSRSEQGLTTVTLVPMSKDPLQKDRGPTDELFRFDGLELRTYLSEDELEDDAARAG